MEQSILKCTKKILGVDASLDVFDLDILTHINAAFSTLYQIGVGPAAGFYIEDDEPVWHDFIDDHEPILNACKTYVYLKVRMLFDPPTTSYLIGAMNRQDEEFVWRISTMREEYGWTPPVEEVVEDLDTVDGGGV